MNNYTPILNEVAQIEVNSPLILLDYIKHQAQNSKEWHFLYGGDTFKERFAKLDLDPNNKSLSSNSSYIMGLAYSLLLNIYTQGGFKYFNPIMLNCGISIKDKHRIGFPHVDHTEKDDIYHNTPVIKIIGLLDSNWKEEWGGGFMWGYKSYSLIPNKFLIFDPKVVHSGDNIKSDQNRIAIDFTVPFKK